MNIISFKDLNEFAMEKPYMFDDEIIEIRSLNKHIKLNKVDKYPCNSCCLDKDCDFYHYSLPCRYDHSFVEVSEIELLILKGDSNDSSK